ncbi:MAG: hypothetical protein UHD09_06280 [Bifidobacterium sp.]|nr:hypothetical protein [Bifidobacterium sp.]
MTIYELAEACAAVVLGLEPARDDDIGFALFAGEPWCAIETALFVAVRHDGLLDRMPLEELSECRLDNDYLVDRVELALQRRASVPAAAAEPERGVPAPPLSVGDLVDWYAHALEELQAHDWVSYARRLEGEGKPAVGLASLVQYAWHQCVEVPDDVRDATLYHLSVARADGEYDADSLAKGRTMARMLNRGHPLWGGPAGKVMLK